MIFACLFASAAALAAASPTHDHAAGATPNGSSVASAAAAAEQAPAAAAQAKPPALMSRAEQIGALQDYIQASWHKLRRGPEDLLAAARDEKHPQAGRKWAVFVSDQENVKGLRRALKKKLPRKDFAQLAIRPLRGRAPREHGILYLPHPYVVPGGRFNEMYAWDSFYIVMGLLRDGEATLAQNMVDNALYEVVHYGTFLNANRSYYLTRSQPPTLAAMVLAIYRKTQDKAWLQAAVPALSAYARFWQEPPHASKNGLSRYYDTGHGPAAEVLYGETNDKGEGAYGRVKAYYQSNEVPDYDVNEFYNKKTNMLTEKFYVGDRSMRESGFDPSARFGPFNVAITSYNPVCLNTLLVLMDRDLAEIHQILGNDDKAKRYAASAKVRAARINELMWDEKAGLYFDYNFEQKKTRNYPFLTTFYPLYAKIASAKQAARVVANLGLFETGGGLQTSNQQSGAQWDAPYGWAPLQYLAVEGLRRYGYTQEADRISEHFMQKVLTTFTERGAVFEKYDVAASDAGHDTSKLQFGYTSNEIGFGWTNAVFNLLYDDMTPAVREAWLQRP